MKKPNHKAFVQAFFLVLVCFLSGCSSSTESQLSQYVFEASATGVIAPDATTAQYVKPVGNLTTDLYKQMHTVPPKWSRFILRDMNAANGLTDSIYDVNVSDQFRFDVEGGRTSIEKPNDSATYIIDVTNAGKNRITVLPRPATEDELTKTVTIVTILLAIVTTIVYLI